MKASRWIFIISNLLTALALVKLYNFTNPMFNQNLTFLAPIHKTLFVDNHFNNEESEIIEQAATEWSNKTNHIVNFDVEKMPSKKSFNFKTDVLIIPVTENFPDIILTDNYYHCDCTLGFFNNKGSINYIEIVTDRIKDDSYKGVVLHEMGHSLGLGHNDDIGTLMYPAIQLSANYITKDDLENFCKLYKCDYKKLGN